MNKLSALLVAGVLMSAPAFAEGISGTYQTAPNDDGNVGHVEFYECGGNFCGKLVRSYNASGQPIPSDHIGRDIVWDMQDEGAGKFGKGKIWDPGADKTYRSKMEMVGDQLKVSGCVGPICRANTWVKVQ